MAFDLENAVQQGWNRDVTTNDWNVEATNLEVILGDRSGGTTFVVRDIDNVGVAEVDSDGYLSILGNAEVHGGHVLVDAASSGLTNTEFVTLSDLFDEVSLFMFDVDPNGVITGTKGSFGTSYNDGYLYINIDDATTWKRVAYRSEIDDIPTAVQEPSGFADKTDSKMEFDDETRTFTITPNDAGYDIYLVGRKVTIGDVRNVTISDTEGLHYIYYDYTDDQLKSTTTFSSDIIRRHAFAASIYWSKEDNNAHAIYFGEERHGITMDGATHEYLHNAFGARWVSGLALGSFTYGDGSADSHAEFAVADGAIVDEDIRTNFLDDAPQDLDPLAHVPVYYKIGAAGDWRKKDEDEFPLVYDGTAGYTAGDGRIPYNQFTGGAWQLTEVPANNYYTLMHYFATNNIVNEGTVDAYGEGVIGVLDENYYTTLVDASDAARVNINNVYTNGIPVKEFAPIATVVYETDDSFTNTPKARVVQLADGSDYVDWRIEVPVPGLGVAVADHGELTGLTDDDHEQYLRTDGTRPLSGDWDAQKTITTPQIRSDVGLQLHGEQGIVLDAYGANVIPAQSCQDSLGDPLHGWTDIYLCTDGTVVALSDPGETDAPNQESGAYLVGTESDNFETFGPDMTSDTVQAALEAIDGYLLDGPTLQEVYDNSCPFPQITMRDSCGPIYFNGTEQVVFNNDGGVDVLNDLIVRGDMIVNGDTTTVNTENMFVEDRIIRLNVGTHSSFSGTVGFEAEVGSDGYVEFHWDDTSGRWEISIDRSTTPEAQTFRPIAYLSSTATTLDLSSTGDDGWPTAGPNPDAGASVVNTNNTNFPYSFGPDMTDDSVQSALEAIDGYFLEVTNVFNDRIENLSLQDIYDQSCPNPSIVTNEACGPITFGGTEQVVFNNDDGVTFGDEVTVLGDGPFVVDINGPVNISGDDVNIHADDEVTISGEGGIVLDGYGEDVIPATSCTDSLGDATHGWLDLYVCRDGDVIALGDEGDVNAPNNDSGAYVISTNSTNFTTFGPDMTTDTVQAALEAIDGYLERIIQDDIIELTLQDIYDNSCGDATIVISEECGPITFEGPEQVIFNNEGGVVFGDEVNVQGDGPFVVDIDGPVNISGDDVNIYAPNDVTISGEGGIILDGYGENVIPFVSCQDSLGDPTHGWTDLYVCRDGDVIGLGDEGDVNAPNNDSGAYVISTNSTNFTTFGPDMTTDTVQAALEAIDGYLERIIQDDLVELTLQDIYDNSCGDATIVISEECGPITFEGPEQVIFNNEGGVVLGDEVTVQGDGPFVIDINGPVNITTTEDVNIYSGDDVNIYGEGGIVLDGYGENVIPGTSCQDSLGDSTHGWTDLWVCQDGTPTSLIGEGDDDGPNSTSGASIVGTNSNNFETFGGDMFENSVQAALEAIDGYLRDMSLDDLDTTYVKTGWLDINGCVLNGVGKIHTSAGTPGLDFKNGGTSRASWSMPVPTDWDGVSDIEVEVIWSPSTAAAGDVAWRLEYKSLSLTELASSAAANDDYAQATGLSADGVQSTEDHLVIPAAAISASDDIIVINIVRRGNAAADTYLGNAYIHLVKYNYVAQNIV